MGGPAGCCFGCGWVVTTELQATRRSSSLWQHLAGLATGMSQPVWLHSRVAAAGPVARCISFRGWLGLLMGVCMVHACMYVGQPAADSESKAKATAKCPCWPEICPANGLALDRVQCCKSAAHALHVRCSSFPALDIIIIIISLWPGRSICAMDPREYCTRSDAVWPKLCRVMSCGKPRETHRPACTLRTQTEGRSAGVGQVYCVPPSVARVHGPSTPPGIRTPAFEEFATLPKRPQRSDPMSRALGALNIHPD